MFTRDRSDFSGSSGVGEKMFEDLRRAGYPLDDEKSVELGMLAYSMASIIWSTRDLPSAQHRPQEKTGRNAPCPCGSGRKYKKCCEVKSERESQPWVRPTSRPELDWRCVPAFIGSKRFMKDLEALVDVIEADPELREFIFPALEAADFYQKSLEAALDNGERPEDETKFLDEIGLRYGREKLNATCFKRMDEVFEKRASSADDPDTFRVFATGKFLCMLHEAAKGEESLLACVIFRISINQFLRTLELQDSIIQRLGGLERLRKIADQDPKRFADEIQELFFSIDRKDMQALLAQSQHDHDLLRKDIKDNPLPVAFPAAGMLPFFLELTLSLREEASGACRQSEDRMMMRALSAAIDQVLPEDLHLYAARLGTWVEENPQADAKVAARVNNVRMMLEIESLVNQFMPTFLAQSAQPAITEIAEAIKAMQYQGQPGNFDAEFLEKYGDHLLGQGYPKAIVLRTWKLCEKLGPLPEGIAEKIRQLSEEISNASPAQDQRQDTGILEPGIGP